jgi:hypothetical protein
VRNTASITPTAYSFVTPSTFSARMTLTVTGATSGAPYIVEAAAVPGADPHILIDTGY